MRDKTIWKTNHFNIKIAAILACLLFLVVIAATSTVQANEWIKKANTPKAGGYGEAVVSTENNIYIARCQYASSNPAFWRYDPENDSWSSTNTSGLEIGAFRNGATLTWDDNDYIYALLGGRYEDSNRTLFYRYNISNDSWERLIDTHHAQGAGDAITWSGYDSQIYAILGSKEHGTTFACYNLSNNSWSILPFNSNWTTTDDGASLVWTGGKYLYALRGEWQEKVPCQDFARYHITTNISNNTWEDMSPIPEAEGVGDGASLLWTEKYPDYIFALGGGSCLEEPGYNFYRYCISQNTWEELESISCPIGYYNGNRLGFANEHIYYWQGTPCGNAFYMFEPEKITMPNGAFSSVIITDVKPTEFHPGETKEVVLTVKNNGGRDARDVKLIFEGTRYVSVIGFTVAQINTLNSWCEKEVKITVHVKEGTPNGVYSIPVMCLWYEYYFDPTKGYVTESKGWPMSFDVSFKVKGRVIMNVGNVYTEPAHVRPGDEDVEIHVAILNTGEAAAKDVEAKLICNEQFEPSWSGTHRVYVGRLNSGYAVNTIFHIDIADNVDAGIYSIPLVIRFKDTENIEYRSVISIDILVE